MASSEDRWLEIKRAHGQSRAFGLETELLSPSEAKAVFPYMTTDGVVGAVFIPGDGQIDPSGLTQAYAKGARTDGVTIREGVQVTGMTLKGGRITEVLTDQGPVMCEIVVNAAGLWAREVAAMAGIKVAAGVVEHQYMVTEKSAGISGDLPTLRDLDHKLYVKPEVGGFAVGGWEKRTKALPGGLPFDFERELLPSNFERFEEIVLPAAERLPILNELGIQNLINGPIPISADGEPVMGPVPDLENLFVACGFTSGIAASGGAGRVMASWIVEGDPGMDLWDFDVRRFAPLQANRSYLHERAVESYARYYAVHWPADEMTSARNTRLSPLHERLAGQGAVFGSKFAWERPNWFAPIGTRAVDEPSFGRANWFAHVAAEHRAVRERVALIDQSSFTKFEISGPGSFTFLQHLAANDLDKPPGSATYTQLCNHRGGIEADLTIMRSGEASFYVVTGSGFGVRDAHWIRSHMPGDGSVDFRDVTTANAVINLCGPHARDVLMKVSGDDLSNAQFPYMSCREIEIGFAKVLAIRLTYVGELGWELHMPREIAAHVYETLADAGREFDIANVGYRAIDSLRMEKRYLYWGADITPDYTPYEAGLGFCVALDKGPFMGSSALSRIKEEGAPQRLCTFLIEAPISVHGGELIAKGGRVLGITTSGNFGHTLGMSIAFGYLPIADANKESYEIECFGESVDAVRAPGVPFDPDRKKIFS